MVDSVRRVERERAVQKPHRDDERRRRRRQPRKRRTAPQSAPDERRGKQIATLR